MTARIGRRVDRNVYWNDQPLFVAATPELAVEIVSVLNRGSEATPATGGATRLDREAVARIIDPVVWQWHDAGRNLEKAGFTLRKADCLRKADAILALDPDPQPQAASEGVREAIQPCSKQEIAAWEEWAKSRHYNMDEHPLHYLFIDPKTDAARMGWKAGLAFALAAITPAGRGADAGGFVLVPRDPTEAMLSAGIKAADAKWAAYTGGRPVPLDGMWFFAREAYAAMLAAAPTAPTAQGEDR